MLRARVVVDPMHSVETELRSARHSCLGGGIPSARSLFPAVITTCARRSSAPPASGFRCCNGSDNTQANNTAANVTWTNISYPGSGRSNTTSTEMASTTLKQTIPTGSVATKGARCTFRHYTILAEAHKKSVPTLRIQTWTSCASDGSCVAAGSAALGDSSGSGKPWTSLSAFSSALRPSSRESLESTL